MLFRGESGTIQNNKWGGGVSLPPIKKEGIIMNFTYEQLKKFLELRLEDIEGWKKDKKLQKQFYFEAGGAVEFVLCMADEKRDRELTHKVCALWNCEIMPKMHKAIWGD
jgi:hypothetical protein